MTGDLDAFAECSERELAETLLQALDVSVNTVEHPSDAMQQLGIQGVNAEDFIIKAQRVGYAARARLAAGETA